MRTVANSRPTQRATLLIGLYLPNERWYVDAMVGYTENDHDQERNISYSVAAVGAAGATTVSNTALSDTDSDEISVSVAAGYNYFLNNWVLSPYGRVEYADIGIDGFTESMAQTAAAGSDDGCHQRYVHRLCSVPGFVWIPGS